MDSTPSSEICRLLPGAYFYDSYEVPLQAELGVLSDSFSPIHRRTFLKPLPHAPKNSRRAKPHLSATRSIDRVGMEASSCMARAMRNCC
jgi:hypothetical protein